MTTYDFCKKMNKETKIAINRWAKRLEADELIIHKNGNVTLACKYGYICYNEKPTAKELYLKKRDNELTIHEMYILDSEI